MIKKRTLGRTGLELSEIGFGCASYWGKKSFNEKRAIRLVEIATEKGVNFFDTGYSYSAGNAEIRLGKALKLLPNKEKIIISSKAGTRITKSGRYITDLDPNWVKKSIDLSLTNIGIDHLPLFQLHGPSVKDLENQELLKLISDLKTSGKVGFLGVNTYESDVIEKILDLDIFDFVMIDYNVLMQHREPVIDRLYKKGIGVMAGSALANSLFSNRVFKIKGVKDLWYLARALKNHRGALLRGRSLHFINNLPGISGSQAALSYVLNNQQVTTAVFGSTTKKHVIENLESGGIELPKELIKRIQRSASKCA